MTTIKKYLVCSLLFNTISLCALAMNPCRGMMVAERRQQVREEDSQDDFSKYDYKTLIEKMLIRIDLRHLDSIKYHYGDSFFHSITSYWLAYNISTQKAAEELTRIGRYIPKNHDQKKQIFTELVEKHWYVYYLMQALIKEKTKEFFTVDGSTIDQLYDPQFPSTTNGMIDKLIYNKACQSFLSNNDLDCNQSLMNQINKLKHQEYKDSKDINCMVLYGYTKNILLNHLRMSADSKYIKLDDYQNDIIVWDMKTGDKPTLSQTEYNAIQWSSNRQYRAMYTNFYSFIADGTENYCATTNKYVTTGKQGYIPIKIDKDKPAIIVYKRPEPLLCLCKIAFERNKHNAKELIALKNSNSFKAIEGFPGKNLAKRLEKRINRLTLTQQVSNIKNS